MLQLGMEREPQHMGDVLVGLSVLFEDHNRMAEESGSRSRKGVQASTSTAMGNLSLVKRMLFGSTPTRGVPSDGEKQDGSGVAGAVSLEPVPERIMSQLAELRRVNEQLVLIASTERLEAELRHVAGNATSSMRPVRVSRSSVDGSAIVKVLTHDKLLLRGRPSQAAR